MQPIELYPLQFEPKFRRYIWGGRRLETVLGKQLGPGNDYAESWEVVDHGTDQSIVANGPLAGCSLHEIVQRYPAELFGSHEPPASFPLLLKFLDANQNLSVQVHPDDTLAARLDPPDLGKTEAWMVLEARPGAVIYAGLKRGFDRAALVRELVRGTIELCLHRFEPRPGDCIFIPAGVVHALGAGLVIAEIQQASDVTFRLFDWNRVDAEGKPRALHLEQALQAIDFSAGPIGPTVPLATSMPYRQRLVECQKFVLDRLVATQSISIEDNDRFHILAVIEGTGQLKSRSMEFRLAKGQTLLIPAAVTTLQIDPGESLALLDVYLP
jgi:mannose-6-phosphate isomerase